MALLTKSIIKQLQSNHKMNAERFHKRLKDIDFHPVVMVYTPGKDEWWLFTEMTPDEYLYGFCGGIMRGLGSISLESLQKLKGPNGLGVMRDKNFKAERTLSEYVNIYNQRSKG